MVLFNIATVLSFVVFRYLGRCVLLWLYSYMYISFYFSPIGQEYPFLQVSEIFLSRPAISAKAVKAVSICQSLLNIAQPCSFQPLNLLLAM